MKKFTAALLCAMLVIGTSVTAFGATKNDVKKIIDASVAFAFDGYYSKDGYTAADSKNLYILARAGADISGFTQAYFDSVADAAADGSLTDPGTIGMAVSIACAAGLDPESVNGVNLAGALYSAVQSSVSSPYSYFYAAEAAAALGAEETAAEFCDAMADYYTLGEGTDFWGGWGTSADDLAMFILTMNTVGAYEALVSDAFDLLENYYTDGGYSNYGANADSTALALAAYCSAGNTEKADQIYDLLINHFYDPQTGGFTADYDEYYATADAVFALSFYLPLAQEASAQSAGTESGGDAQSQAQENTGSSGSETQSTDTASASPATGAQPVTALCAAALAVITGAALLKKDKRQIK